MKLFRHSPKCCVLLLVGLAGLALVGCNSPVNPEAHALLVEQSAQREIVEQLFDNALSILGDVEHSDSADLNEQVAGRLNQWIEARKPLEGWQLDPLLGSLPEPVRQAEIYRTLQLRKFRPIDIFWLQEAMWLKSAARQQAGKLNEPVQQAEALFRWITRQIVLVPEDSKGVPHAVWETLLIGRGTAVERLWAFTLLARQADLDVVALAIDRDGELVPWCAALFHNGELYLFDPALGQPIRTEEKGKIATLKQLAARPAILESMKIDDEHPYRVQADDLKRVVALVECSPPFVAERFRLIELRLTSEQRLRLSVDASALAEELKKSSQVASVLAWAFPWERAIAQLTGGTDYLRALGEELLPFRIPPSHLWKGRVMHLTGRLSGDATASQHYQECRPSKADLDKLKVAGPTRAVVDSNKLDATYWLGLLAFERGNYPTAIEYLDTRLLKVQPTTRWADAARLILAECYEASGDKPAALAAYRQVTGPLQANATLRAKQLDK